jgi:hypothetical protein
MGNRDDGDFFLEVTIDHLHRIQSFSDVVFPWPHSIRTIDLKLYPRKRIAVADDFGWTGYNTRYHPTPGVRLRGENYTAILQRRKSLSTKALASLVEILPHSTLFHKTLVYSTK